MCSNSRGHCRFTGHWFIRSVSPLFIASPSLTALNIGPYAPITETVPPLRTESMARFRATGEPPCSFSVAEVTCCRKLPSASAPTASMATSAPRWSVIFFMCTTLSSYSAKLWVSAWAKVRAFSSRYSRWSMTMTRPAPIEPGRLGGEQPHRAGPEDHDHVPLDDVAELGSEVAGGEGVGEQHRVLVVHPVGDEARPHVGEGHPDELGLAAVVPAAGVGVAVDAADRGGVGVDVVAAPEVRVLQRSRLPQPGSAPRRAPVDLVARQGEAAGVRRRARATATPTAPR